MGMRIQGSSGTGSSQGVGAAQWQQRQQDFKDLFSSLQSGDLSAAQKAMKGLTGGSGKVPDSSPLAAISQALQAGDVAQAQSAAQQFQSNRATHRHHHEGAQQNQSTASAPTTATGAPSGLGSTINLVA